MTRLNEKRTRARIVGLDEQSGCHKVDLIIQDEKRRLWGCYGCRMVDPPNKSSDGERGVWLVEYQYQNRLGMAIDVHEIDLAADGSLLAVVPDYTELMGSNTTYRNSMDSNAVASLILDRWEKSNNG